MPNALILVGGFGTRLRPLTFDFPKPLVPFANEPVLYHQLKALQQVGVKRIVLAVAAPSTPGMPNQKVILGNWIPQWQEQLKLEILINEETTPLGTAGPIKLAKDILTANNDDKIIFVLNSDVTCRFPLVALLETYKRNGGMGTLIGKEVVDPSKFGVMVTDSEMRINRFVEKPTTFVGNLINAGIYCLSSDIIEKYISKPGPCSIEREVFPQMAADNVLYCMRLEGFWADVGQPRDYLIGLRLYLEDGSHSQEVKGSKVLGNVIVHPSSSIGEGSVIGPNVTVGANCKIGKGVRLQDCAVFDNVTVGNSSYIRDSIVSNHCVIGDWVRLEDCTVLAQGVNVADTLCLSGVLAAGYFAIKASAKDAKLWC